MVDRERPTGVLILVVLYIILAVLRMSDAIFLSTKGLAEGQAVVVCLAPTVILGIFYLLVAVGLFRMKTWAWIFALVLAILGLAYAAIRLVGLVGASSLIDEVDISAAFFAIPVISLILNGIVIVYLLMMKKHFR
jgi:hypothetical protein